MRTHPNDLLYTPKREAGLGMPDLLSTIQWRKLGILYRIVQRDMPSREAGEAMIEREFQNEAVHLLDRQATLSKAPRQGQWMTSLREFLHNSHVYLQYNNLTASHGGASSCSIMRHCVPGLEDEVEEELARQDICTLRDISTLVGQEENVRSLIPHILLDSLIAIPLRILNEPYTLTRGLMFLVEWEGHEKLIEFMGALKTDGAHNFMFRSMINRSQGHLNVIGSTYVASEQIDIVVSENFLGNLTKRAHTRTSAQTAHISKYLTLIGMDIDNAPVPCLQPLPSAHQAHALGGEFVIFTDGSFNEIKEVEHKIFGRTSGEEEESSGASGAVVYFRDQIRDGTLLAHEVTQLIRVPDMSSEHIPFLTPYMTEAIAIIGALSILRRSFDFHTHTYTIYSDCESLVKAILSSFEFFNPILNRDPYLAAIHHLSTGLSISFRWVRSHIERRNKIPSTWSFLEVGNYLADRLADGDEALLSKILTGKYSHRKAPAGT